MPTTENNRRDYASEFKEALRRVEDSFLLAKEIYVKAIDEDVANAEKLKKAFLDIPPSLWKRLEE